MGRVSIPVRATIELACIDDGAIRAAHAEDEGADLAIGEPWDTVLTVDEGVCVRQFLGSAELPGHLLAEIQKTAEALIERLRHVPAGSFIDEILRAFPLSSDEGRSLLATAEAFLRTPDRASKLAIAFDKLVGRNWSASQCRLSARATVAVKLLSLAARLAAFRPVRSPVARSPADFILAPLVAIVGDVVMRKLGQHFVLGESIEEAVERSKPSALTRYSFDMLGEAALSSNDAETYFKAYARAIDLAGSLATSGPGAAMPSISVKLSALHPRFEYGQRDRVLDELTPRVLELAKRAMDRNVGLTLDAEESDRLLPSMLVFQAVARAKPIREWEGFGIAVQAYQRSALSTLRRIEEIAADVEHRLPVRLVKGAYWDWEIKRAQDLGLSQFPVFTRKATTDACYLACARVMAASPTRYFPQFATHNAYTAASVLALMTDSNRFEFQRLHGMGEALYRQLQARFDVPVRIYAPVGVYRDLLPYLVRRLLENGANSSFVQKIGDTALPASAIARDPFAQLRSEPDIANPRITPPRSLLGPERMNSRGYDLTNPADRAKVAARMRAYVEQQFEASPIVGGVRSRGEALPVRDPSNRNRILGRVVHAGGRDVDAALKMATEAFPRWDAMGGHERGKILEKAADIMEGHMAELMGLIAREGGRTVVDGMNEVREAVDFLRYYAVLARKDFTNPEELPGPAGEKNLLYLRGRGTFICIAPWNFPLAIFVGQIAAALAAGNCVVAKPAEQTPLIGDVAIRILHQAGVPPTVLHYLPGEGQIVGDALVRDARIAGVAFTGSTETAKLIHRILAEKPGPIVPLIAETGGQNAMIVDSTAFIEQTVRDAVLSAFDSAGQRCSALRVLYVQNEVADRLIQALKGAMEQLRLGDPIEYETDVGPMIDEQARAALAPHIERMKNEGRLIYQHPGLDSKAGLFFPPIAFEIPSIKLLQNEVFGPVLHVVRWKREELDRVLQEIRDTGFALTMGVQTRVDSVRDYIFENSRAGNVYVNRTIIGAVVGVQPFGGEGLSGTGPKAGGPRYLYRYATERTLTINTAAAGGDAALVGAA